MYVNNTSAINEDMTYATSTICAHKTKWSVHLGVYEPLISTTKLGMPQCYFLISYIVLCML